METNNTLAAEVLKKNNDLIDDVNAKVDIVETIKQYISLKDSGDYLKGICPLNDTCGECFTVHKTKKIFYCFGCHQSGTVVDFLVKFGSMNKHSAARFLDRIHKHKAIEQSVEENNDQKTS